MKKHIPLVLAAVTMFNGTAAAAEPTSAVPEDQGHRDEIGLGIGALIGGLIAGPPGAIIGAAGGAWYGDREDTEAVAKEDLEDRLHKEQTQVAYLQNQLTELRSEFGKEMRKVKLQDRSAALQQLSRGISMTVYFRTDSARIDNKVLGDIHDLAVFLKDYPEVQLHLEAHADRRGSEDYNKALSRRRALAVREALTAAGIDAGRIHAHAYGETDADTAEQDREGMIFDRRVNIVLNLDSQA